MIRVFSPVFTKELRQLANSRWTWRLRLVFLAVLGTVLIGFIGGRGGDVFADKWATLHLFRSLSLTINLLLWLMLPLVTAAAVAGERQANTLGLLFMTRLRRWQIVQDKALARVFFALHLSLLALPLFFAIYLIGGLEASQIVGLGLQLLRVALLGAGVGLLCSASAKTAFGAAIAAYVLYVPVSFIDLVFGQLMRVGLVGRAMLMPALPVLGSRLVLAFLLYGVCVLLAARRLGREDRQADHAAPRKPGGWKQRVGIDWVRWIAPARAVGNPVFWRQLRRRHSGLHAVIFRLANIGLLSIAGICVVWAIVGRQTGFWRARDLLGFCSAWTVPGLFIAGLCVILLGAGSVAGDRQDRSWQILLTAPRSGGAFARGMLFGNGIHALGILLLAVSPQLLVLLYDRQRAGVVLFATCWMLVLAALLLALGVTFSVLSRSATMALSLSLLAYMGIVFFPLLAAWLMAIVGGDGLPADMLLNAFWPGSVFRDLLFDTQDAVLWAQLTVYGGTAILLWGWLLLRFDAFVGRQRGRGIRCA